MITRSRVVGLLFALFLATPLHAAGEWVLRLEAGATAYSQESFAGYLIGYDRLELDGGMALGLAAEYRASEHFGVAVSWSRLRLDAQWQRVEYRPDPADPTVPLATTVAAHSGDLTLQPLGIAAYWHPLRHPRFDLYLGPQLAWVPFSVGVEGAPDRDAEWAYGGELGGEIRLGDSPWSVGLTFRHLEVQHDGAEHDLYTGMGLELYSAVLSYRFGSAVR